MDNPETPTTEVAPDRGADGRFLEGNSSGGRPKGSRNRVSQIRLEIEESVRLRLAGHAMAIIDKAISMAKEGDQAVMKVLLDKMLSSPKDQDDSDLKPNEVKVVIVAPHREQPQLTIMKPSDRPVIDVTPEKVTTK